MEHDTIILLRGDGKPFWFPKDWPWETGHPILGNLSSAWWNSLLLGWHIHYDVDPYAKLS